MTCGLPGDDGGEFDAIDDLFVPLVLLSCKSNRSNHLSNTLSPLVIEVVDW